MPAHTNALVANAGFDRARRESEFAIFGISPDEMDDPFRILAAFVIRLALVVLLVGLLTII